MVTKFKPELTLLTEPDRDRHVSFGKPEDAESWDALQFEELNSLGEVA